MKYPVLVQKQKDGIFIAFCPVFSDYLRERFCVKGDSFNSAIEQLQERFLCHLKDDNLQMEIIYIGNEDMSIGETNGIR